MVLLSLSSCSTTKRVAKAEPEKAPWQTLRIDRAQAKIEVDGQVLYSECQIQAVYDSLLVISIRPVLGLEAFRVELERDGIRLIDRLQQRYTEANYGFINTVIKPQMTLRSWERWLTLLVENPQPLCYTAAGHQACVEVNYEQMAINEGARVRKADLMLYEKLSVVQFISNL